MGCVPWTPPWRFPLWFGFLGLHFGPPKSREPPGVDTSHVGRSGTLGSQPSLEKGGRRATEEMDQIMFIKSRGSSFRGQPPTPKKKDGMERSLNYWKAECFGFVVFFFRKSFWQNSLLNLRLWISDMCTHFPIGSFSHSRLIWYVFFLKELEHITLMFLLVPKVAWFWNTICHQILSLLEGWAPT